MRIISDFKDYYDTASSYGIDPKLVYVREVKNLQVREWGLPPQSTRTGKDVRAIVTYMVIGFCGEYFPLIRLEIHNHINFGEVHYCYSYEEYKTVIDKFGIAERRSFFNFRNDAEFFTWFAGVKRDEAFVRYNSPIFLVENTTYRDNECLTVNPRLKGIGFARIKDPVTAFQEVSMYLGNQLVKEKQVEEISDKHKIAGHGFDLKTSFRHPIK